MNKYSAEALCLEACRSRTFKPQSTLPGKKFTPLLPQRNLQKIPKKPSGWPQDSPKKVPKASKRSKGSSHPPPQTTTPNKTKTISLESFPPTFYFSIPLFLIDPQTTTSNKNNSTRIVFPFLLFLSLSLSLSLSLFLINPLKQPYQTRTIPPESFSHWFHLSISLSSTPTNNHSKQKQFHWNQVPIPFIFLPLSFSSTPSNNHFKQN